MSTKIELCTKCCKEVVNDKCGCDIVITQAQYDSLCQTDQLKLRDIMRKLGGELNGKR